MSIAKGLSAGGDAQVSPPVPVPAVELPVEPDASPVVETASGDTPVKTPSMGKAGLNVGRTSGGGLSM
ncbi:hypothetical protein LKD88_004062 [Escherichia coli]|uniref:hypothetical protein n=1 Tax=Escherichia coli TaxID=562 RepID=UPI0029ED6604|nr:hypothetical protein [Escherichia coli]EKQ6731256.1 hypothetical protein [Escherichia coli]HAX7163251.1 hypothetical protein [Escherichia coli]